MSYLTTKTENQHRRRSLSDVVCCFKVQKKTSVTSEAVVSEFSADKLQVAKKNSKVLLLNNKQIDNTATF